MNKNQMNIIQRAKAPTPKFFKTLKIVGLALAGISASILALPVTFPIVLPAAVIAIAGHLAAAGGVMTAVSQMAVEGE